MVLEHNRRRDEARVAVIRYAEHDSPHPIRRSARLPHAHTHTRARLEKRLPGTHRTLTNIPLFPPLLSSLLVIFSGFVVPSLPFSTRCSLADFFKCCWGVWQREYRTHRERRKVDIESWMDTTLQGSLIPLRDSFAAAFSFYVNLKKP